MENTQIVVIEKETQALIGDAENLLVTNQIEYEGASNFLKAVKTLQKKIKETFDPIVSAALKTHREATNKRKEHLEPALKAEKFIKDKMVAYVEVKEKERREKEEKLARQAAAEEKRKREALEARAAKAAEQGKIEKAEELREKAEEVHIEAPVLAQTTETPKGVSYKDRWFVKSVDKTKLPIEWLEPNMQALNKHAQNTKGKVAISGVEFDSEKIVASRSF